MDTSNRPHVIVVGGGIVGASIAWHLALETSVTLIAEDVGGPASTASFAWLNASSVDQKFYHDFRCRSLDRWRQIHAHLPNLPISWNGSFNWHKPPEVLDRRRKDLKKWGYKARSLWMADAWAEESRFDITLIPMTVVCYDQEGAMEAHIVARELIADAQLKHNLKWVQGSVKGFVKNDNRVTGVWLTSKDLTRAEVIRGDHIVVAAGLGSVPLLASEGIMLPLTSVPALVVNTKPTKKLLKHVINSEFLYMRQTPDGVIKVGCENPGDDPGSDPEQTAHAVFAKLQETLAGGDDLEFDYFTIGHKPTPKDGLPIIGATGLDTVSVAVMHSGVTNAAIVGQLLSKQILTGETDPALEFYRLDRFKD